MAIRELLENGIEQSCEVCGAQRLVADAAMSVGVEHSAPKDRAVVPLPPCDACGAVEYLVRSSAEDREHSSPGSFGHLHRLLVDALHARLVKQSRMTEDLEQMRAHEVTAEELERWFKGPLRLRREQGAEEQPTPDIAPADPPQ